MKIESCAGAADTHLRESGAEGCPVLPEILFHVVDHRLVGANLLAAGADYQVKHVGVFIDDKRIAVVLVVVNHHFAQPGQGEAAAARWTAHNLQAGKRFGVTGRQAAARHVLEEGELLWRRALHIAPHHFQA